MAGLQRRGAVFVLTLGDDENRFHPDRLTQINAALDEVEAADGPKAIVTTGHGKFYSNGLDLDFMAANPGSAEANLSDVHALFARVLAFPAPIVAAVQGHAFAAGAMLALAHDLIVMRGDRGFFCLPEVDLGIPFTAGMNALIRARLPIATAHEAMTTGRRYGGEDAREAGIVAATAGEDELLDVAVARAEERAAKAGAVFGTIKERLYAEVIAELRAS
ncbi:enoyl-CoA hydratase-related protein [Mycolicibacterium holsaticum]|jgi:enoyl-CoA hydratase/carnithine racemase|uniref:enoyl-CoA hydratase-related protein n=1 Tax=Mycolicibacterium holsaticum TaxID=152142 RepID=UPI001C7D6A98|nr:enoyl-CoA hydratase-related protein [Mycolicibacterium holsaticum]MDA4108840.1 enoyl-CoA hydratase [Mycolicibacterium holsaticum DSM 44478 = JCM 12374]QZA12460.1 enoyl-CoA hydratase/isomerase family protein [Mycolicibacterium holsaticum DSM 44478 = JCM 12374]UNC10058.1 enoyl-CoA hydratase/isomerase family protein [Mycolicibacterium holsaticum DSM 44478 = JCM 12374]